MSPQLPGGLRRVAMSARPVVVWLHGDGSLLRSVRLGQAMDYEEFAHVLATHIGWQVPASVLRAWEREDHQPPRQVIAAARLMAS